MNKLQIFSYNRSGSHYLQILLQKNFRVLVEGFSKHEDPEVIMAKRDSKLCQSVQAGWAKTTMNLNLTQSFLKKPADGVVTIARNPYAICAGDRDDPEKQHTIEYTAEKWSDCNRKILKFIEDHPETLHTSYEDLLNKRLRVSYLKKVGELIGQPNPVLWEDIYDHAHSFVRPKVKATGDFDKQGNRDQKYMQDLSDEEIKIINGILDKEVMDKLGYVLVES